MYEHISYIHIYEYLRVYVCLYIFMHEKFFTGIYYDEKCNDQYIILASIMINFLKSDIIGIRKG